MQKTQKVKKMCQNSYISNKYIKSISVKIVTMLLLLILVISMLIQISYARYVIEKNLDLTILSKPCYFNARASISSIELQGTETSTNLIVSNNDGTNYDTYNTNYQISIQGNDKFSFTVDGINPTNGVITKTINGGSLINDNLDIKFMLKSGVTAQGAENVTLKITSTSPYEREITIPITIAKFYSVNFVGFDNLNPTQEQQMAASGQTYTMNIGDITSNKVLVVEMNNTKISNYTYNNATGIISIPNVNGNITITSVEVADIDYVVADENTPVDTIRVDSTNPVSVNDFITMQFSGKNLNDKRITKISVTIQYTTTTGSAQSVSPTLKHNGNTYKSKPQTVSFKGKTTNGTVTVDFEGLNIQEFEEFEVSSVANKLTNRNVKISRQTIQVYYADN